MVDTILPSIKVKGLGPAIGFETVGFEVKVDAGDFVARPVMFAAGDDGAAKALAPRLVAQLGIDAIDAGPLKTARLLEPFGMLWIDQVLVHGAPRDNVFAFLCRQSSGA